MQKLFKVVYFSNFKHLLIGERVLKTIKEIFIIQKILNITMYIE